jgi:hypothetical protein
MISLSEYLIEENIVKLLASYRAKHSHRRHKLHMMRDISLHDSTKKIQISKSNKEFEKLQSIFPPRRKWLKLNEQERKKHDNSIKRVTERLYKCYACYKQKKFPLEHCEEWYQNLISLVNDIRQKIENLESYEMQSPKVLGILKKLGKNKTEYRPIAIYELEDRVISSLTSRYLTDFFDHYFFDCSFAFRSSKRDIKYNHHKSIEKIIDYRSLKKKIWVSECDIQKFFDTVNHNHIREVFIDHIKSIELLHSRTVDKNAILIFNKFLNSFSFNVDVYPKNNVKEFWKDNKLKENGYFKWIEEVLIEDYGLEYLDNRIGVPQGNAISCFISNLLLHNIDSKVRQVCSEIFYVRFCDDMILMHEDKKKCQEGLDVYKAELKKNYLSYHPPTNCEDYLIKENWKKFWRESKSKEPYLWANPKDEHNAFPWLSFVGYQIKYDQDVRLRRDTIKKEKRKQIQQVENVLKAIAIREGDLNKTSRKSARQIVFSLQTRLNSMSVGRIKLYSYKSGEQGLCWTNGFEMIKGKKNKSISKQLKHLDSFREKQIWRLKQNLKTLDKKSENPDDIKKEIYFGSPYSYHSYLNNYSVDE